MSQSIIEEGFALLRQCRHEEALEKFTESLSLPDSDQVLSYYGQGIVYREQKKHQEALGAWKNALELNPQSVKALASAALLENNGDVKETDKIHSDLKPENCKDYYDFLSLGLLNFALGNPKQAKALYENASKQETFNSAQVHLHIGNILYNKDELGKAEKEYNKALEQDKKCIAARVNKATILLAKGHTREALKEYDKAIKANLEFAALHHNKGNIYFRMGKLDDAKSEYNAAIRVDEHYIPAYVSRAKVFLVKKNYKEAAKTYDDALKANGEIPALYFEKGNILLMPAKYLEAKECFDKALKLVPNFFPAMVQKLEVCRRLEMHEEAASVEDELLKVARAEIPLFEIANRMMQSGQVEGAISLFNKVLEINPEFLRCYFVRAVAFYSLGMYQEALIDFDKVLETDKSIPCMNYKALCLLNLDRAEEAKSVLEDILRLDPNNAAVWNNLGNVYLAIGDKGTALQKFDKALEMNPRFLDALLNKLLVIFALEQKEDTVKSEDYDGQDYAALERTSSEKPPDYDSSQRTKWQDDINSYEFISDDIRNMSASYNAWDNFPELIASKVSDGKASGVEVTKKLLGSLAPKQTLPEDVMLAISFAISKIISQSPENAQDIIAMAIDGMDSDKESDPNFVATILCNIINDSPEVADVIGHNIERLLDSDNDLVMHAAAKVRREVNKKSEPVHVVEKATQTIAFEDITFAVDFSWGDLEKYRISIDTPEKEKEFLDEYIAAHKDKGITEEYIVFSLALISAILFEAEEVIQHILSKDFGEKNIWVVTDENSSTPVSSVMASEKSEIFSLVTSHVISHKDDYKTKPFCQGDVLREICNYVRTPKLESFNREDFYENVLVSIYDPDSLGEVRGLIGDLAEE